MKYKKTIKSMNLEEKAGLLSGKNIWETKEVSRLSIPSIHLADGPHGIRKQIGSSDHLGLNSSLPATCFPTAATIANSWDLELGKKIGAALGIEALSQKVNVILGPGLNIKRSPLCGRNFEYFSEDPYLSGKMAASFIQGIQSQGVAACPKHFAVNNQEKLRMINNSILDERTLHEIYLAGFEIAVKEGKPWAIMSSYNLINDVYANENSYLLQDILREEWGFDGAVITDWGGSNNHIEGVRSGSTLEMPGTDGDSDRQLVDGVKNGKISEEILEERVDEILHLIHRTQTKEKSMEEIPVNLHHSLAQIAAESSIVLLKNEDILPIDKKKKIAIIGDFACSPRYQGAGSSVVNPMKMESTLEVLSEFKFNLVGYGLGFERNGGRNPKLLEEAKELASKADTILLYIGLNEISESEGTDRRHMKLMENQIELIDSISKVNPNIVAVLSGGSAIEMPWLDKCKGLLHGYLSGQAGARAILRAIVGDINPSGKLAETYPIRYQDTPAFSYWPGNKTSEYREGLYVGYRYYETADIPVLFPFGFGLSYTSFSYNNLEMDNNMVSFTITNDGSMDGAEIAQVYVKSVSNNVFRPMKELCGFQKVFLKAGETKKVEIKLRERSFEYFNTKTCGWESSQGNYSILVGSSIRDIHLTGEIYIKGSQAPSPYKKEELPSYYNGKINHVSVEEFEKLLGKKVPESKWDEKAPLTMNDAICQMYYAKSFLARLAYKILSDRKKKSEEKGKANLNILFIYNMPFRGIGKMMNGAVSMEMVEQILIIVNGRFFKGTGGLIKAFFANRKNRKRRHTKKND